MAEDTSLSQTERNKAHERAKMQIEKRSDVRRQREKLIKKYYNPNAPSQSIELETFQKNDKEREERQQQIQSKRKENDEIMNDKNSSPEEKERARQNNEELDQEQSICFLMKKE